MSDEVVVTSGRQVGDDQVVLGLLVAAAVVGVAAVLARKPDNPKRRASEAQPNPATVLAARRLNRAAGTLAFSVLADAAIEHYRGSFHNPFMYVPLVVSGLSLTASAHGHVDRKGRKHRARNGLYGAALVTGAIGTAFHIYNVRKRGEGLSWQNLFYAAPVGAPSALALSGAFGAAAERIRGTRPGRRPKFMGYPAGRATAALASIGMFGAAAEAGLFHFRGAYHNPFMFVPVTLPPVAGVLLAETAFGQKHRSRRLTRWWLRLTAAIGFAGAGFHAYGVHRNMGGWTNWSQNLLNGPPLPAPPAFTGLALAGLAALNLFEDRRDA